MTAKSDVEAASDAAIRTFIAIELDDATRRATAAAIRELREGPGGDRIRWARRINSFMSPPSGNRQNFKQYLANKDNLLNV